MRVKFTGLLLFLTIFGFSNCFAQLGSDGSYLWNSTSITYSFNDKTELAFGNKDQYSNQIDRLEYYHFELIGYRKLTSKFSLGLGVRQTESYKSGGWIPGQTYLFYGILFFNPFDMKIKFSNRLAAKVSKTTDTQYGLDNISTIDFFTKSKCKFPRPYLMDELFLEFKFRKGSNRFEYTEVFICSKKNIGELTFTTAIGKPDRPLIGKLTTYLE